MIDHLDEVDWSLMGNMSLQEGWLFFYTIYEKAMDQFIFKSVPTMDCWKKLWMNLTALTLHKTKRQTWMKYKQTKSYADHLRATQLKNELSRLTCTLGRDFERDLAHNVKNNPKVFWQYCNSKLKNKPRLADLNTSEGALAQGDNEKAYLLNEYFVSVYTQGNLENLPSLESKHDGPTLRTKLLKLNVNKAKGPDGFHLRVLRENAASISQRLCHYRQQLLSQELEDQQHNANTQEVQQNSSRQ